MTPISVGPPHCAYAGCTKDQAGNGLGLRYKGYTGRTRFPGIFSPRYSHDDGGTRFSAVQFAFCDECVWA